MEGYDKAGLRDELIALLAADLEAMERAHRAALEGATHEEAKPENDKDTRALEQSYLARGQAKRIEELRVGLAEVRVMPVHAFGDAQPAALGALLLAEQEGGESLLYLAPHGGGSKLARGSVQVVTPKSPLGRAALGARAGEDRQLVIAGKTRTIAILRVE